MICVGFSTTTHALSRFIRWVTRSKTSHAWMLFDLYGIPMVYEATFEGARFITFEHFQRNNVIVKTILLDYDDFAFKPLLKTLGTPYDFGGLIGEGVVQLGQKTGHFWRNPFNDPQALFCSEIIVIWLQGLGHPAVKGLIPEDVSPQELLSLLEQ
jgi:hypothetical protein